MKYVNRQILANSALRRWREYYEITSLKVVVPNPFQEIAINLHALGPNPNPDEVDSVIGNDSWTHVVCGICGDQDDDGIEVQIPNEDGVDQESDLCRKCVEKMREMLP